MEYKVLKALNTAELTEIVNNSIKAGWKPLGGVTVHPHDIDHLFSSGYVYQAMIKENL